MDKQYCIHIRQKEELFTIEASEKESILTAMQHQRISYPSDCGGRGTCGKCKVKVQEGHIAISSSDQKRFTPKELDNGIRLACTAYPTEDITITMLSAGEDEIQVLTESSHPITIASSHNTKTEGSYIGIDLGTTTLAFMLVDALTGATLATYSHANPQRVYGADVVSRMKASMDGKSSHLRDIIRHCLKSGIQELIRSAGAQADPVHKIAIAGNTTMIHLLMGYPCDTLGVYPFTPVNIKGEEMSYHELFSDALGEEHRENVSDSSEPIITEKLWDVPVSILPGISAYVGGDIVAGLGVCDFDRTDEINMLIDLGTNGEIAIGNKAKLIVGSTAAGPAFEGGNISCGMASIPGAISQVQIEGQMLHIGTIRKETPIGICGTGVVELCAELLRSGGLDATGLLGEAYFTHGYPLYTDGTTQLLFTQKDVRELQLAKAAIRAGIEMLLSRYGISYAKLDKVYLAGGFGFVLDLKKAVAIGLLPEELENKVITVGNSSLAGALSFGRDPEFKTRLRSIIQSANEVHLSMESDFQEYYLRYINFPDKGES